MANVFEMAQAQVKNACDKLGMEPQVYELLKEPRRVIEVNIPVKMDDGSIKVLSRCSRDIDLSTVMQLDQLRVVSDSIQTYL